MVPRIAITGGPCAGKSTAQTYLLQKFGDRGYYPLFVPESPTLLMLGNLTPVGGKMPEHAFQRGVVETMDNLERTFENAALASKHPKPLIFCDRGIPDAESYMGSVLYQDILNELRLGSKVIVRDRRYKGVFHLRSAALGAEEFYTTANNVVRRETLEEARDMDERTLQAWNGHPHLRVIDNSTDFADKLKRLDREVCALLGIPIPIEIEKKFLCEYIDPKNIPVPVQEVDIEQMYLYSPNPALVPRVRKRGQFGSFVYFETEKRLVGHGANVEIEHFTTAEKYEWSLRFKLPSTRVLGKNRCCFIYENQYFELDLIPTPHDGVLPLLEIEVTDQSEMPQLPPFLKIIEEVTGDPHFNNRAIAEHSWRL